MTRRVDIVVVGGGMAGFSAAMAATGENKKVLLIEKTNQLGGNATNVNVGTICGTYYRTFSDTPKIAGYTFTKSFLKGLLTLSPKNKALHYHNGLYIISYDWFSLANHIEKMLIAENIEILKNTEITAVTKSENRISSVTTSQGEIFFDTIIDCSGNGVVAQLAGLEMIVDEHYQAASQIFFVKNIHSENEFSLNMALKKTIMKLISQHKLPQSFLSFSVIPASLQNKEAYFKLTLPDEISDNGNSQLHEKALAYIHQLFPLLKQEIESLHEAEIDFIFPQTGIRTQHRAKGIDILTEKKILTCHKPSNGIAIGTWPIEEWATNGKLYMEYFKADDAYYISANCLQSVQMKNLYFGGKNISATQKAIASARVIGICLQTGYAAGKLASCNNEAEKEKMIHSLHQELLHG